MFRTIGKAAAMLALVVLAGPPATSVALAQVRNVDPNDAIDRDLAGPAPQATAPAGDPPALPPAYVYPAAPASPPPVAGPTDRSAPAIPRDDTYGRADVLGAAERSFGKGAAGLAEIIERTLKDQGRPNAYIAGSEGGGAVIVGLRYGSGLMSHKVEGERRVHWTGPSVGLDLGGDANKVFILVYNLYDTNDIFKRFPAAEGRLYFIGGFAATYLRRGNVVLIPIRLGIGYRAGINAGYLKFSKKGKWFPL